MRNVIAEVASNARTSKSLKKGTPQVEIDFQVDGTGEVVNGVFFITEAALAHTVEKLRACGWKGDDLDDLSSIMPGTKVGLALETEQYNGESREKIVFVNAPRPAVAGLGKEWRDKIAALGTSSRDPFA